LGGKPGIAGVLCLKLKISKIFAIWPGIFGAEAPILPQIETAQGFWNRWRWPRGASSVLLFGSIDFQLDLGMAAQERSFYFSDRRSC